MDTAESASKEGKNLWSSLLQEVKEKSAKVRQEPVSVLVIGDEHSGKSTLVARLQHADPKNRIALSFDFIEVADESVDDKKLLNVWLASSSAYQNNLLRFALNESNFMDTLVIVVASYAQPWNIVTSIEEWLNVVKKHTERIKISSESFKFCVDSLTHQFQEYSEPTDETHNDTIVVGKRRDTDINYLHPAITEDPNNPAGVLDSNVFTVRMGVPIIVVITKTDYMETLEAEHQYDDDKFDYIQMNIRKLCLKYGAALCYTSLKESHSYDVLQKYLVHRCYGFNFYSTASILDKSSIFIPAGWDNHNKINILEESLPEGIRSQNYNSFVSKPLSLIRASAQSRLTDPEMAEEEQVFLMRAQAMIQRIKAAGPGDDHMRIGSSVAKNASMANPAGQRSRKGLSTQSTTVNMNAASQQANEGVLANFFSSLLNKRGVSTTSTIDGQQSVNDETGKRQDDEAVEGVELSKGPVPVEHGDIQQAFSEETKRLNHMETWSNANKTENHKEVVEVQDDRKNEPVDDRTDKNESFSTTMTYECTDAVDNGKQYDVTFNEEQVMSETENHKDTEIGEEILLEKEEEVVEVQDNDRKEEPVDDRTYKNEFFSTTMTYERTDVLDNSNQNDVTVDDEQVVNETENHKDTEMVEEVLLEKEEEVVEVQDDRKEEPVDDKTDKNESAENETFSTTMTYERTDVLGNSNQNDVTVDDEQVVNETENHKDTEMVEEIILEKEVVEVQDNGRKEEPVDDRTDKNESAENESFSTTMTYEQTDVLDNGNRNDVTVDDEQVTNESLDERVIDKEASSNELLRDSETTKNNQDAEFRSDNDQ